MASRDLLKKNDYIFKSSPRRSRRRRGGGYGTVRQSGYRRARLAARQQGRRRRSFVFILAAGVIAAALVFTSVLLLVRARGSSEAAAPAVEATSAGAGSGTVIITGKDDAGGLAQLAVMVPADGGGYSFYTIPPRTIADTPGYGFQQLGRVAEIGGQELLDQTVANLLQTPIRYHIDFAYPALEAAAGQAGTVNFRTDRPLALTATVGATSSSDGGATSSSTDGSLNLAAGDNPVSAERAVALLKASVADGQAGPKVQALFYQGLRDSLALKSEPDRRVFAQQLARQVETDMDEGDFVQLLLAVTARGRPFGAWPLPVRLAAAGPNWYLEPVPAEIKALMTGAPQDATITLEIHNGTAAAGVVEAAAERLAPLRYNTSLQTNPSGVDFDNTQIRVGSEALTAGNRVRELLGKGTIIKDEYMEKHQIIVIIGRDITLAELEKR